MSAQAQAQDYWPGFLDILVNVMLYLLLLVSSFALGSVALTLHSMQQQFQLSELDVGQAVEMQSAELNEEDRRRLMLRLESLDVQAMLKRREEVDRERQLLEARRKEVERELAQQQRTAQEVRQRNRSRPDREAVQQEEVRLQQQRSDYEFTLSALGVELSTMRRNLAQASESLLLQKQSQQAKAEQVESDFRVSSVLGSVGIGEDLQVIVERRLGRSVVAVWEFEPGELMWPAAKVPPISGMPLDQRIPWRVVTLTDTGNVRLVRESFARVNSVRDALIARGFERERIKVEVLDFNAASGVDGRLFRTVLMLPDQPEN